MTYAMVFKIDREEDVQCITRKIWKQENAQILVKWFRGIIGKNYSPLSTLTDGTIYRTISQHYCYDSIKVLMEQICLSKKECTNWRRVKFKCTKKEAKGEKLSQILGSFSLKNVITSPTRITKTTENLIDLILVKDKNKI